MIDSSRPSCNDQAMEHRELIELAIALSQKGVDAADGGPFGAVVAREGEVISEGWNHVLSGHDPTAHAEIVAIRAAARTLGSFSLAGCVLYSSCEPCPMCLGATYWARIDHIYYANTRADAAAIGFDDQLIYDELSLPTADRSLPATHLQVASAELPMRAWSADAKKISY
jgi:tRNA(Arg) A34 adenosine deaminase TadA